MAETWFISDTHFGHKNILEFEKEARPFNSVEEMNECIIERWNHVVNQRDTVYHLGDFCFGRSNIAIAERLHGKKTLIMGNHDIYPVSNYLHYFHRVFGALTYKRCVLSHIPVHFSCLGSRYFLNIHGHLHSKKVGWGGYSDAPFIEDINYFNVSCEQNNLTPINYDQIKERLDAIE